MVTSLSQLETGKNILHMPYITMLTSVALYFIHEKHYALLLLLLLISAIFFESLLSGCTFQKVEYTLSKLLRINTLDLILYSSVILHMSD